MELTQDILDAAESVVDGFYPPGDGNIDWIDFLERVEGYTGVCLGDQLDAPHIGRLQRYVRKYRNLG